MAVYELGVLSKVKFTPKSGVLWVILQLILFCEKSLVISFFVSF